MKAQEWLDRGNATHDPIDAFSNYYKGLNNLFSSITSGSERDKIKQLIQDKIPEKNASQILETHSKNIDFLLSTPVIDMRGNGKDTREYIANYNSTKDDIEKLKNVFMVIYQIRCNLEHGQKSPSRERDISLCQNTLPLLDSVITACLK